jgi:hypothetical protein
MGRVETTNGESKMTIGQTLVIHERAFDAAIVKVVGETQRAVKVQNIDNGYECYFPKSVLQPYKPGEPTYENEYRVSLRFKLDLGQERVLNIAE